MNEENDPPSHADIAARAEQIYQESGSIPGRDVENWMQAETELKKHVASLNGWQSKEKGKAPVRLAS